MNARDLTVAITWYFAGERREMFAILGGCVALLVIAGALHAVARDGFSRGFGVTAMLVAAALSWTALALLRRDPPHEARLVESVQGPGAPAAIAAESARMEVVISKYPAYRYAAFAVGLAALLAAAFWRRGWVVGAAAGLLVLVVAQLAIDHYSEARARRYAGRLAGADPGEGART